VEVGRFIRAVVADANLPASFDLRRILFEGGKVPDDIGESANFNLKGVGDDLPPPRITRTLLNELMSSIGLILPTHSPCSLWRQNAIPTPCLK
jgi:hypothetical protein